ARPPAADPARRHGRRPPRSAEGGARGTGPVGPRAYRGPARARPPRAQGPASDPDAATAGVPSAHFLADVHRAERGSVLAALRLLELLALAAGARVVVVVMAALA